MSFILYLHGFRSSPASFKAQQLGAYLGTRGLQARWNCPALSAVPATALAQCEHILAAQAGPVTLVGSSLGGFYASCLAERHGLQAALINPAVPGCLHLAHFLGEHDNLYTGERFTFTAEHAQQLEDMTPTTITPERYWVLLEQGDEVLDWRDAAARYAGARVAVLPDGDHSFTRFAAYLPQILEFAGL